MPGDCGSGRLHEGREEVIAEDPQNTLVEIEPLLMVAEDAARLLSVGKTHLYAMHNSGRLGPCPIRLGRKTLWSREELQEWVRHGCPSREKWLAQKKDNI